MNAGATMCQQMVQRMHHKLTNGGLKSSQQKPRHHEPGEASCTGHATQNGAPGQYHYSYKLSNGEFDQKKCNQRLHNKLRDVYNAAQPRVLVRVGIEFRILNETED